MPAVAVVFAKLLNLPPLTTGVVVLFAAMPTGANAYIFAAQYQRLVNQSVGRGGAGDAAGGGDVVGGGGVSTRSRFLPSHAKVAILR
jgi:hypothetical protein